MVNLISDYVPPFSPLPNIAPFTYKDGETYLSTLDRLRTYINNDLVDFINTNFTELSESFTEEVNTLITTVNAQLAAQDEANDEKIADLTTYVNTSIANLLSGLDNTIAGYVNDSGSDTREALDTLYSSDVGTDSDVAGYINDSESDTREALDILYGNDVGTDSDVAGYINDTESNTRAALIPLLTDIGSDSDVADYINDTESDTREALDALYTSGEGGATDADVNTIVSNVSSSTRGTLDALYANQVTSDSDIAAYITDDESDTRAALDNEYIPIISGVNKAYINNNTDTPALLALDEASTNQGTIVIRQSGGRVYTGAPTNAGDATTKQYVDTIGTSNNDPNTIVRRSSNGQISVATTPAVAANATSKQYVDGLVNSIVSGYPSYVDWATLDAVTGMSTNDIATIDTLPGVFFKYDGTDWQMVGTAVCDDATDINNKIPAPLDGWFAKSLSSTVTYVYNDSLSKWVPVISDDWISYTPVVANGNIGDQGTKYSHFKFDNSYIKLTGHIMFFGTGISAGSNPLSISMPNNVHSSYVDSVSGSQQSVPPYEYINSGIARYYGGGKNLNGVAYINLFSPEVGRTFAFQFPLATYSAFIDFNTANVSGLANGHQLFWNLYIPLDPILTTYFE